MRKISAVKLLAFLTAAHIPRAPAAPDLQLPHHVIDCIILDHAGNVLREMGGNRCVFWDDGSFVRGTDKELTFFHPDMSVKWSKKMHTHHQLGKSVDGKRILVMEYRFRKYQGKRVRFDRVSIINLEGKELYAYDFYTRRKEIINLYKKIRQEKLELKLHLNTWEFVHTNSISEIPENESSKKIPAFAKGHIIVNSNLLGFAMILDAKLKEILWILPPHRSNPRQHDVHVLPNGKVLIYDNVSHLSQDEKFSTIDEFDPVSGKREVVYQANPPPAFFSPHLGGAQRLPNGNLLISDVTNGAGAAHEIDKTGKRIWTIFYPKINKETGKPFEFQEIKRMNLTKFLERNLGL
jgi:hypothetical protein